MQLGDQVEQALSTVGITQERVTAWVGVDCGCQERKEKLNRLGAWASRVVKGKTDRAKEFLNRIIEERE